MSLKFLLAQDPVPETLAALGAYDPLSQRLLHLRGMTDADAALRFFAREYDLHDPFLMNDMDRAVERILRAIEGGERITIYSDYDCDGIPGGSLMHDFFKLIKYENFDNYIPHRHEEGYGLNMDAVAAIAARGTKLMITVDCGITDNAEVAHAQALGVDVIVTDHHEPASELPPGYAVLNPKRADTTYPFRELCGTGVAWKLIQGVLHRGVFGLEPGQEKWLLDLVGLATIADMVPLTDENRVLAYYGLFVMRKGRRLGLRHLMREMRMDAASVVEDDIGFMIGPRINAASRMDSPEDAFRLLTASTDTDAGAYARHLDRINKERKGVVGAMVKDVKGRLAKRTELGQVITVGDPSWRPALVGLAANTLAEAHARPVFLWGRDGRGVIKGSCRSQSDVSVVALMREAHDVFLEYGGHHASGGFSVKEEMIHRLPQALEDAYARLENRPEVAVPETLDATLTLAEVTPALARTLARFAPFGMGNRKPLFLFESVTPQSVSAFGREKDHLKARFAHEGGTIDAVAFFKRPEDLSRPLRVGEACDLVAHVEESTYGGRKELRLRIVEALPPHSCRA